jgi:hypothetical protein
MMIDAMPATLAELLNGPKPVPIQRPAVADSLAGVLSRLFPGVVDSASVDRIHWMRQGQPNQLGWAPQVNYAYRQGPTFRGMDAPVVAKADPKSSTITLSPWAYFQEKPGSRQWLGVRTDAEDPEIVKHEMLHLMHPAAKNGHPADLFATVESYRGR